MRYGVEFFRFSSQFLHGTGILVSGTGLNLLRFCFDGSVSAFDCPAPLSQVRGNEINNRLLGAAYITVDVNRFSQRDVDILTAVDAPEIVFGREPLMSPVRVQIATPKRMVIMDIDAFGELTVVQ